MAIEEIVVSKKFTGYFKVSGRNGLQIFLFFVKGVAYSAGEISGSRPSSLGIKEFFEVIPPGSEDQATVSLIETDPVLMKGMLVFFQKDPSIKAGTDLINLDDIVAQIENAKVSAVIFLRKGDLMNQFFFKDGFAVMCHSADPDFECPKDAAIAEKFQLYAYQAGGVQVEAILYRDIKTCEAEDAEEISDEDLMLLPALASAQESSIAPQSPIQQTQDQNEIPAPPQPQSSTQLPPRVSAFAKPLPTKVTLAAVEGPVTGNTFTSSIPCLIGRKEASIIINDPSVSRHHASLKLLSGKLVIEDKQSTNGTQVNGVDVKSKELAKGDRITIGDTVLIVENIA